MVDALGGSVVDGGSGPRAGGDSALDDAATGERLRALRRAGVLDEAGLAAALGVAAGGPDAVGWRALVDRLLLGAGAGLSVAGVIFFFAANWAALHRFGKLGSVALLVAGAAGWALARPDRASGRVALTAAAGLVGGLLAVYGQIYQTGADVWTLFGGWALLIAPWVVAARFEPLVLLWLVVVEVGIALWADQIAGREWQEWMVLVVAAPLGVAWQVREWLGARRERLGASRWFARVMFIAMATALTGLVLVWIVEIGRADEFPVGIVAAALLVGAGVLVLRRDRVDLVQATGLAAAVITVVTVGVGRVVLEGFRSEAGAVLLLAVLVIGEVAVAAVWLRRLWQGGAR